jgi:uncharacterized protein YjbJ (UPF0337 family)
MGHLFLHSFLFKPFPTGQMFPTGPQGLVPTPPEVDVAEFSGLGTIPARTGSFAKRSNKKEAAMDWNRVEGNWKEMKGKIKEQWGKLTDDDLDVIAGKQDQLEGRLQQRYGYAKDQAKKEIDTWYDRQTW